MSTLEFFSSLVQSLAWPISVILIIFILRKPISELTKGISKVKYQDLEIDFGKKLAKIEQQISSKDNIKSNNLILQPDSVEGLETIAYISPKSSIVMAWTLLEKELNEVIHRLIKSPESILDNSLSENINLLCGRNLIDSETIKAINDLRKLRNSAAHDNINEKKITTELALKYYNITQKIIAILRSLSGD